MLCAQHTSSSPGGRRRRRLVHNARERCGRRTFACVGSARVVVVVVVVVVVAAHRPRTRNHACTHALQLEATLGRDDGVPGEKKCGHAVVLYIPY